MSVSQDLSLSSVTPRAVLRSSIFVIGASMTLFTLYFAWQIPMDQLRYSNIFLGLGLTLFYLVEARKHLYPDKDSPMPGAPDDTATATDQPTETSSAGGTRGSAVAGTYRQAVGAAYRRVNPAICLALAVLTIIATGYVEFHFDRLLHEARMVGWTQTDLVIGLIIVGLVTEATGRAYGKTIAAVVLGSVLYATSFIGPNLPGLFRHTGMDWQQISREGAISLTGTYGFILEVGATWVAIFIMFAGMAKVYGLMDFIIETSQEVLKVLESGVVHIAIISSMAMGSITGSAAANTATTGSFTIPMMKNQGIREDFAAAIESVASTGGQMLPPVMGVAAFIMADILGVSYFVIIQAGIIPALLFYFSVMVATHLLVLRHDWKATESGRFDRSVLLKGVHFLLPLAVLIYTLVVMRLTPLGAGFYTILTLVATMYVRNAIVDGVSVGTVLETTKQTLLGLRQGAVEMAPLVGILASLGVVINMLTQTGLTQKISAQMISLSGGVFVILLLLAMVASILFGLGMPTPAAYILVVVLVAPAMIQYGVAEISAHMFVFYFAMLSAITPPVAIAVAIGSKISGSGFLIACKQALRIGAPGFIIPFSFIANESLIYWTFPNTAIALVLVLTGIAALIMAMIGYNGRELLTRPKRLVFLVLALAAMVGPFAAQVGAVVLIGLLLANAYLRSTPEPHAVADD
ncbi:TRAP transporter fused permease subunit [Salinadaptatus halalkaliphilus]|uniref:TRAP transporter fused permease subunit n=1 Tax=Salinadaptatus halalkaliphilus TaxID=2419781 RepID=A0A4S3TP56_9EURY|nr:TRAP transporter fused permease subunit [Salinadaptatus halalkaliphilus]THE65996.1 TRAP transporter fused permease subunit [Salinadaptatus halalkaliphilus]